MKNKRRFVLIFWLVMSLLFITLLAACQSPSPVPSPVPSPTQPRRTSVTGTMIFFSEISNPDLKQYADDQGYHTRNSLEKYMFKTSDERLNGWGFANINYDYQLENDGKTIKLITNYGTTKISPSADGKDIIWECTNSATLTPTKDDKLDGTVTANCEGKGTNEGLKLEFTLTATAANPDFALAGVITE